MDSLNSLRNHFLIAMPEQGDSFFSGTITYICNHDAEGAMGLVVNQLAGVDSEEVFDDLGLDYQNPKQLPPILAGGPVDLNRGFVLHGGGLGWKSTLAISDRIFLTTSADILRDIAEEQGPEEVILTLGYSGWGPGQLEQELLDNAWLTLPADEIILFHTPIEQRVTKATAKLGIDLNLVAPHGHG